MSSLSSITAVPADVLWEQGIIHIDNTTPWAYSTGGGARFEPGDEWRNIAEDIDGVHHKMAGADVKVGGNPVITGTIVQMTAALLAQLSPGSSSGVVTTVTTVTPAAAGDMLDATTDYLDDVRAVYPIKTGKFFIVHFPKGLVTQWTPRGGGKGEKGAVDVTIEARGLAADVAAGTAPYKMYISDVATTGQA